MSKVVAALVLGSGVVVIYLGSLEIEPTHRTNRPEPGAEVSANKISWGASPSRKRTLSKAPPSNIDMPSTQHRHNTEARYASLHGPIRTQAEASQLLLRFKAEDRREPASSIREDEVQGRFVASNASQLLAEVSCKQTLCRLRLHNLRNLDPRMQLELVGTLGKEMAPLSLDADSADLMIPFDADGYLAGSRM
jgi:hypothetical protein